LNIFVVDVATRRVRQLTQGVTDEHAIDWSPDGAEILFASNHEPNADEFFKHDIFGIKPVDGGVRRLTASEGCACAPHWSPEGKHTASAGERRVGTALMSLQC
jgi:Tol biopolymer transport system component